MKKLTIPVLSMFMLQSCATMFHGSRDTINVRSNEDNTKIYIDEAYVGKNSGVQSIPKKGRHYIRVSKDGCDDTTREIVQSFDGVTLLGFLIDFGIISILAVDGLGTGAWMHADQTNYVIDPVCKAKS